MAQVILRGEGLSMLYRQGRNEIRALDGVDVAVAAGEMVAVMGPSGCGKSTLLHLLAGIDVPTAGRVFLNEIELSSKDGEERAALRRALPGPPSWVARCNAAPRWPRAGPARSWPSIPPTCARLTPCVCARVPFSPAGSC